MKIARMVALAGALAASVGLTGCTGTYRTYPNYPPSTAERFRAERRVAARRDLDYRLRNCWSQECRDLARRDYYRRMAEIDRAYYR